MDSTDDYGDESFEDEDEKAVSSSMRSRRGEGAASDTEQASGNEPKKDSEATADPGDAGKGSDAPATTDETPVGKQDDSEKTKDAGETTDKDTPIDPPKDEAVPKAGGEADSAPDDQANPPEPSAGKAAASSSSSSTADDSTKEKASEAGTESDADAAASSAAAAASDTGSKDTGEADSKDETTRKPQSRSVLLEFPAVRAGSEPRPLRISREAAAHPVVDFLLQSDERSLGSWIRRASLEEHVAPVDGSGRTLLHCLCLKSKTPAIVAVLRAGAERLRERRDATRDRARRKAVEARQGKGADFKRLKAQLVIELDAAERLYHVKREAHARGLLGATDEDGRTPLHYACGAHGASVRCLLEALPACGADLQAVGPSGLPLFPPGSFVDTRTGMLFGAPAAFAAVAVNSPPEHGEEEGGKEDGGERAGFPPSGIAKVTSPFRPREKAAMVGDRPRVLSSPAARPASRDQPGRHGRGSGEEEEGGLPLSPLKPGSMPEHHGRDTVRWGASSGAWGATKPPAEAVAPDGTPRLAVDDVQAWRQQWIDATDADGHTALHIASAMSDAAATRLLVSAGADRYAQSAEKETAMSLATADTVRRVLLPIADAVEDACSSSSSGQGGTRHGDVPQPAEEASFTASQMADIASGPLQALRLLLSTGTNPNARSGTLLRAPLHAAVEAGQPEVVSVLLQSGAEVGVIDANGWTPLALAAYVGTGVRACSPGHLEVVKRLLAAGAAVDATTSLRRTALHLAAGMQGAAGDEARARWDRRRHARRSNAGSKHASSSSSGRRGSGDEDGEEKENGEDEDGEDREDGEEEETAGDETPPPPGSAMLWLLLEHGANPECKDQEGLTPLLHACKHGRAEAAAALLACGATMSARNPRGATALHLAAKHGHRSVCRLLVRHDAERGALKRCLDSGGRSPADLAKDATTRAALDTLWEAAAAGRLDMTQRLLRAAARVPAGETGGHLPVRVWEKTAVLGRTPLHAVATGAAAALASAKASKKQSSKAGASGKGQSGRPLTAAERRMRNVVSGIGLRVSKASGVALQPLITRVGGKAAAEKAAAAVEEPFARVAAILISSGGSPDAADSDGLTPVMLCARYGLTLVMRPMLSSCTLSARDKKGNTALHWARACGQELAAMLLEDEGADRKTTNEKGDTPEAVSATGQAALTGADSAEAELASAAPQPKLSETLHTTQLRSDLGLSGAAV